LERRKRSPSVPFRSVPFRSVPFRSVPFRFGVAAAGARPFVFLAYAGSKEKETGFDVGNIDDFEKDADIETVSDEGYSSNNTYFSYLKYCRDPPKAITDPPKAIADPPDADADAYESYEADYEEAESGDADPDTDADASYEAEYKEAEDGDTKG
jgi:hypothetical protein